MSETRVLMKASRSLQTQASAGHSFIHLPSKRDTPVAPDFLPIPSRLQRRNEKTLLDRTLLPRQLTVDFIF